MGQYALVLVCLKTFTVLPPLTRHSVSMLKYPIPKDRRIALARLYFHVCTIPGLSTQMVATCSDAFKLLTKSKKQISIDDLRLPWKPVYDILSRDLFLSRRQFEYTYVQTPYLSPVVLTRRVLYSQLSWCMGYIAENARRFFHPAAINDMLSIFLPKINGTELDVRCSNFLTIAN